MYDLYSPDIQKIEVIKLERRLDNDLSYLKDALPEYSTFDQNMDPTPHRFGKSIEINPVKVRIQQHFIEFHEFYKMLWRI